MSKINKIHLVVFLLFVVTIISNQLKGQDSIDYSRIDRYAANTPKEIGNDLDLLVNYLNEISSTDKEKVRAFYIWIIRNIKYDKTGLEFNELSYNHDPVEILARRKAVCTGFSQLFKSMCEKSGIPSEVVSGYSREGMTGFAERDAPDHAWNAVFLEGRWKLIDATWDAGLADHKKRSMRENNRNYFLIPPSEFIRDHLPSEPMWQLLRYPLAMEDFRNSRDYHLSDTLSQKPYAYKDSIDAYLELSLAERRLHRNHRAYLFHPSKKNKSQYGHALIDYASALSDSIEKLDPELDSDLAMSMQQEIIDLCKEAHNHCAFQDWQNELEAGNLINHSIALYNREISEGKNDPSVWAKILSFLEVARDILKGSGPTFYTDMAHKQCEQFIKIITPLVNLPAR